MKIKNILEDILSENHKASDYKRWWNKETGLWEYEHRNKLGLTSADTEKVVHHKDGNIHNNKKSNLQILDRGSHAAIGKPALKWDHCKIKNCKEKHFSKGYCRKHYWEKFNK